MTQGTVGIFRDISLVSTSSAVISFVTPQVFLRKDHWDVKIAAYLMCKRDTRGMVTATLDGFPFTTETEFFCEKGGEQRVDLDLQIPENAVKRWYPVGYGDHPTYSLTVSYRSEVFTTSLIYLEASKVIPFDSKAPKTTLLDPEVSKTVHIGFRTADLIRENIGVDEESIYFRINDIDVFIRGRNETMRSPQAATSFPWTCSSRESPRRTSTCRTDTRDSHTDSFREP